MAIDGQIRGAFLVLCGVVRARVPHGVCHATCRVFGPERASITLSASNNASVLVVFSMLALAQKLYCARGCALAQLRVPLRRGACWLVALPAEAYDCLSKDAPMATGYRLGR
jgi:hypothetical protein